MTELEDAVRPSQWQRLSTRMLLVHPVKELLRFLPAVVGLLIAGTTRGNGQQWWWGLVGAVVPILLGMLRWYTTRYRFTDAQVQLRHGLISRTTLTAPMDRVRTVDVTASPLHRLLGLAEVRIGTAAAADEHQLTLDGLTTEQAAALRQDLLHRHREQTVGPAVGARPAGAAPADQAAAYEPRAEEEIVRLDPRWIRFAPFGPSGVIAAAAIVGVGFQILNEAGFDPDENSAVQGGLDQAQRVGVWVAVLLLAIAALVLIVLLSLGGYVLLYWGFRLTRHAAGGTLHVARGLLTTRATTLEERRIRGVELQEPLPLRSVSGARLTAITTGLKGRDEDKALSSLLVPPAPAAVAKGVADRVLTAAGTLAVPLRPHGRAATRRRWTRALVGGVVLAVVVGGIGALVHPVLVAFALVPLVGAALLAADRARALGHALTDRYLVSRSGSVLRATHVLERSGVIGVTVRRSFFQRRMGVATLTVATAAGRQRYHVVDVRLQDSTDLAAALLPGHLEAFRR
ncbi:PH domain-containing protein [Luteipulveratus sp. YIM 133132]|uniref:PH domain-containing protein n=1 Tax=Luteipulveratus flavus TaxID=3031728 RepID=UPI0023AF0112|nr:PH domain-containing protein [Luteipulveratus sp. YIM 133132]MDE9364257.1 PH domain-containing protein [Luteipulveratus sp. YIM 133132]